MPDLTNRDAWERKLAREVGRLEQVHLARLIELLGDPPNIANVPGTFWDDIGAEMVAVIRPLLENIYRESAEAMLGETSIGVDWALVNQRAVTWAQQYAFDLVKGINDNTRAQLQQIVSGFFGRPTTMAEIRASIEPLFGPVRAAMIASTEVTRAAVQGELAFVEELRQQGATMIAIWQTNADDLVCPICAPLNGKRQGEGWNSPPPAHVNCRCWLNHEVVVRA